MSEESVGAVRKVFAAFNQHDPDLLVGSLAEDCIADWSASIGPDKGVYRGRAEVRAFYEGLLSAWADVRWEPLEMLELDGARVLSVNRLSGRGRGSGVEVAGSGAIIWTVRNGEVADLRLFQNKHEALEAAGLSE